MHYFGERWDAPAFDDAVPVPTPVGDLCLFCAEHVAEGDNGVLMPYASPDSVTVEPVHLECYLRSLLGCVAHLEKRCSCYGGADHDGFSRQAARELMAWLRQYPGGETNAGWSTCPLCARRWLVTPTDDCLMPACGCYGHDSSERNPARPCERCGLGHSLSCPRMPSRVAQN